MVCRRCRKCENYIVSNELGCFGSNVPCESFSYSDNTNPFEGHKYHKEVENMKGLKRFFKCEICNSNSITVNTYDLVDKKVKICKDCIKKYEK